MKETQEVVALVVDTGLFTHVARRLSRDIFKTYYWVPWESAFPRFKDAMIGDGYGDIIRVESIEQVKAECDLFCYDDQTEILTENGWRLFKDLKPGEPVATLNPLDNCLEYHAPSSKVCFPYRGDMLSIESCRINFCVTPNHKMYANTGSGFGLVEAEKIYRRTHVEFSKTANWQAQPIGWVTIPAHSVDWSCGVPPVKRSKVWPEVRMSSDVAMAIMGFYLAEGSIERRNSGRPSGVSFGQNDGATWDTFVEIIKKSGLPFTTKKRKTGFNVALINSSQFASFMSQFGEGTKKNIPKWVKAASSWELKELFDWYMRGDGSNTGYVCSTVSRQLAHDLQEVCLKIGYSASEKPLKSVDFIAPNGKGYTSLPSYRINISRKYLTPQLPRLSSEWKKVKYSGFVHCVTVTNHIIYVRRNGVAMWCGNCFPDIGYSDLQCELAAQGKAVWGCRHADELEARRGLFLETLQHDTELPVPKYQKIKGLTNLVLFLKDNPDRYIKVSTYRGDFETCHFRSLEEDYCLLDSWGVKLGPLREEWNFFVFEPIDAVIEDGVDTYCIDGRWPSLVIHGVEQKDQSYLGAFQKFEDVPPEVRIANDQFGPVLARYGYRSWFSTEVRITEDDDSYFTDPTCRAPSPPSQVMCEMIANYGDVIWHGANGTLIDPEPAAQFGVQAIFKVDRDEWGVIKLPEELDQWVKVGFSCKMGDKICVPPDPQGVAEIGWVTAIGDTMPEAIETLRDRVGEMPEGCKVEFSSLADLLKEVRDAQKEGMSFSDEPVPEPASILEE